MDRFYYSSNLDFRYKLNKTVTKAWLHTQLWNIVKNTLFFITLVTRSKMRTNYINRLLYIS